MAVDILRELVSLDTSEPNGSTKAAKALAARFGTAGFPRDAVQVVGPQDHPEKGNLVVRLAGRGAGKAVLWTSHLDVVSADSRDWSHPPFELTESQGYWYGRGVSDMKGEIAAVAVALIRLRKEGYRPDHDIIAAFTADEEAAGHVNGIKWLLKERRDLVDAAFVLNPDAGGGVIRQGRRLYYGVQAAEKTYATYRLSTTSPGGHSSRPGPEADNAIYRLSAALLRVSAHRFPVRLNPVTRSFLTGAAQSESAQTRADMLALVANTEDADAAARLSARPDLNAILRTTCVTTLMEAGEAENALPQRAQASLQCRLLPGDSAKAVMNTLRSAIDDPQVEVALPRPVNDSPATELNPRVLKSLEQIVGTVWPGVPMLARMDAGGSDAIFTRAAGIPTYGVSAMFTDVDDNRRHGRDERMKQAAFEEGVEFTYRLMKRFGRRD
jgi:acetylornithine deacetylase/succinyl-diaminopimelate desuccinylase-like protein